MKNLFKSNGRRGMERFFVAGKPLAVMRPAPSCPGKLLRISRGAAEIVLQRRKPNRVLPPVQNQAKLA
jgi:hypothetical protein